MTVYVGPEHYPFYLHKGRLCQHSSVFEKEFHGSFEEATTGSMYLEEDGVDEFKLFEEWLYSEKFSYPKDSDDPSLLLMKVFCFAEKIGVSNLQNATLDAIRERATEQQVSLKTPNSTYETCAKPQVPWWPAPQQTFDSQMFHTSTKNPGFEKPVAKYLPPATSSAIHYAYENTPERSSLRKLLTDIFAFNVEPETLDEDIHSFPAAFLADVLLTNMKRLPLRLKNEKADFDKNADKYHVQDSSSACSDRKQRTYKDVEPREPQCDFDQRDGLADGAPFPESEPIAEAAALEPPAVDEPLPVEEPLPVDEDDAWGGFGGSAKSSNSKRKKKGMNRSLYNT